MSFKDWILSQKEEFKGEIKSDELLSKHTYYKIGGPADVYLSPQSLSDLVLIKKGLSLHPVPFFILGAGSNLLVSDSGFRGLIIRTTSLNKKIEEIKNYSKLILGSSVMISTLLRSAAQNGWAGLEFLAGVPGTVGGVATMNAGTHLGETKSALQSVTLFSFDQSLGEECFTREVGECDFEYRKNLFLKKNEIIYETIWQLGYDDPSKVKEIIQGTLKRRKDSQPVDLPSCGSVFKNPYSSGFRSWEVMDKLGLRGYKKGEAQFSEKHPNFIVNHGGAQASDVKFLIDLAKTKALSELNVILEEEVKFLGEF